MNDQSTPGPTTFAERLRDGHFVMTAEVAPPVSCDPDDLRRKAAPLKGLVDAVNVTDGAGARAAMSALAAAALLRDMASSQSCRSPAATRTASRSRPS